MTTKVYTIGYGGRKPAEIKQIVEEKDAVVFDIRFSPRSRNPQWAKKNISATLGEGRYQHMKAFGNVNYRSGPIEFVDFEAGVEAIRASDKPIILMCVCKTAHSCHRTEAANLLRQAGFDVEEIGQEPPGMQGTFIQMNFGF